MLTSATTLLERRTVLTGDFGTHPYEAGWAVEALFYVRTEGPHPPLTIQAQVSPDGVEWLDRGAPLSMPSDCSQIDVQLYGFGTWIRLFIAGSTPEEPTTLLVHLALKG